MRYGIDYLASACYPEVVLKSHPKGWAFGAFASTFGNVFPLVKKLLKTGRCPEIRIHGVWADDHKYKPTQHWPMIRRAFSRCKVIKRAHPDVEVQFSPFCEHTMDLETVKRLHGALEVMGLGGVVLVNSVWTGALLPRGFNEVHGDKVKAPDTRYNFSFDGADAFAENVEEIKAKMADASTFYFWSPHLNLKYKLDDSTPRPQRKYKPTAKHIKALSFLANNRGDTYLEKGWLLKPLADDHGKSDPKSNKVVVIGPELHKEILVGREVLECFGPFEGGGFRYYADKWGFEIVEEQGIELPLRAGGRKIGTVNPAFRCGVYR
jgi:hypothetical protein